MSETSHSAAFNQAIQDARRLQSRPDDDDLLELYALYKIATEEDYTATPVPNIIDLKGRAKRSAWNREIVAGTTVERAQERYIAAVEKAKGVYGYDADKTIEEAIVPLTQLEQQA